MKAIVLGLAAAGSVTAMAIGGLSAARPGVAVVATALPVPPAPPRPAAAPAVPPATGLRVAAQVSHAAVPVGAPQTVFATVAIEAAANAASRPPLRLVLVIDASGSMAGRKIAAARRAAAAVLERLGPLDEVAVVSYAGHPNVLVGRTLVQDGRDRALAAVRRLRAGGDTDIAAGLWAGAAELGAPSSGPVQPAMRRIVLVSDGIDETGRPDDAIVAVASGIAGLGGTVSTIGVGADFNDALLARLADTALGNYHFLPDAAALERVLERELGELETTVAREIVADVALPPAVRIVRASGGLVEAAAARREQHDRVTSAGSIRQHALDRLEERLRHHHHAGAAPERRVVDAAVAVVAEVTQVVDVDARQAGIDGAPDDPFRERRRQHAREDRDHVNGQHPRTLAAAPRCGPA